MAGERLYFNGIDAVTGRYVSPPLTLSEVANLALGEPSRPARWQRLKELTQRLGEIFLGLPHGTDPLDLAQTGWAVVCPAGEDDAVLGALSGLLELRRGETGPQLTRILDYREGESPRQWLNRHGTTWGSVRPEKVPYYLLLIGGPEKIPFEFQFDLAVEYAVGRLGFERGELYRRYAESLVAQETEAAPRKRRAAFFAPRHDRATELSESLLTAPLIDRLTADGVDVVALRGDEARREALTALLHPGPDEAAPAVLFTASHGLRWDPGSPGQEELQGSLLCQGWDGKPPAGRFGFGAPELDDDARVDGLVAFLFACYGAGTPEVDSFPPKPGAEPRRLAPRPFLGGLPRRLLSHPRGAALAVVAHVDRLWGYSFTSRDAGPQIQPFSNSLRALLAGERVGHAVRDFQRRYAALAVEVGRYLKPATWGLGVPTEDREPLAAAWLERNDARNWTVLGDPAARLRLSAP